MRSVCRALLLMSLVSFPVWAQNQNANAAPSAGEEIKSKEQEQNVAILNGDAATLDRMTADDYTFITLSSSMKTSRCMLCLRSHGKLQAHPIEHQLALADCPARRLEMVWMPTIEETLKRLATTFTVKDIMVPDADLTIAADDLAAIRV
jgi:hypothetical protein